MEMDAGQMTVLETLFYLALGFAAGTLFFALLHWNTRLYMRGGSVAFAVALQGVRVVSVGGVLVLIALLGALPLLLTALGLLIARAVVLRCMNRGVA
jgi:F1F0 ATPase subunit 2